MSRPVCTVVGGTGVIGRALVDSLSADWQVRVVSRRGAFAESMGNMQTAIADVSDARAMLDVLEGSSVVFLLTTAATGAPKDLALDIVTGASNVAYACRTHGVRRLVFTSSIAALDLSKASIVTKDQGPCENSHRRNYYARYKIEAEHILLSEHRASGLPVVILRPGIVVGHRCKINHGGLGDWPSDTTCLGFGNGNNPLPFVLIQDVVSALIAAAFTPDIDGLAINLVGDVRPSAREFIRLAADRSRRRYTFYPYDYRRRCVHVAKWLVKLFLRKPGNRFPWRDDMKSMASLSPLDCATAKRLLHWEPNADRDRFIAEVIDGNLPPMSAKDLRMDQG